MSKTTESAPEKKISIFTPYVEPSKGNLSNVLTNINFRLQGNC
jgi:hypothetical protein